MTDIDMDALFQIAKAHDLTGIVYTQLKTSSLSLQQFKAAYYATIIRSVQRDRCFEVVKNRFKEQQIKFVPVKGIAIAELYPIPMMRTMGDIDLLICEEDKTRIKQIMIDLGYQRVNDESRIEMDYMNSTIEFEISPLLIDLDELVEKKEYIAFFNHFWDYVDATGKLKNEFHLLYLLVHLRKHFLNHGVGMRQFMDIAVFTKTQQMDWEWINKKLRKLSLTVFAETVYAFIERWFGFRSPLNVHSLDDEFYAESTERILQNGVFGFYSADDKQALISYSVAKYGMMGKLKYFLSSVFPRLDLMKQMNEYAYLNNKPWLLLFAWGSRLVKTINKEDALKKTTLFRIDSSLDRVQMINKWGLKQ